MDAANKFASGTRPIRDQAGQDLRKNLDRARRALRMEQDLLARFDRLERNGKFRLASGEPATDYIERVRAVYQKNIRTCTAIEQAALRVVIDHDASRKPASSGARSAAE